MHTNHTSPMPSVSGTLQGLSLAVVLALLVVGLARPSQAADIGPAAVEMGPNDFRISDMGPDGSDDYNAYYPAVVYNNTDDEYLVVWSGDDDSTGDGDYELWGQRLDPAGTEIGTNDFHIELQVSMYNHYTLWRPALAYNSVENHYLAVWCGSTEGLGREIWGQLLDADGSPIGANLRISDMGPDTDDRYRAEHPQVTYNSADNEFLVVWGGDDNNDGLVYQEYEIRGQCLGYNISGNLEEVGPNDFRISNMGPDGSTFYRGVEPAVAYNTTDNQYLVVWLGGGTLQVWGQRISASGDELGGDFQISHLEDSEGAVGEVVHTRVAYNSQDNKYLVVFQGEETPFWSEEKWQIYGQEVSAAGDEIGTDFQISHVPGNQNYDAEEPAVAYDGTNNEYAVVWNANMLPAYNLGGDEIFGQRINASTGAEVGPDDFLLSDMGGDSGGMAYTPAVAYNGTSNEFLAVWRGDDGSDTLFGGNEVYGQRFVGQFGNKIYLPVVVRDN